MIINDDDNGTKKDLSISDSDIEAFKERHQPVKRGTRSHKENEELANRLQKKLGGFEREPYLAVAYSGIPRGILESHAEIAKEKGNPPARLFMFLVSQERLWQEWKRKKAEKEAAEEVESEKS